MLSCRRLSHKRLSHRRLSYKRLFLGARVYSPFLRVRIPDLYFNSGHSC